MLNRRQTLLAAIAGVGAGTIGGHAAAAAEKSASDRLSEEGPEARLLAGRVGFWDVTETVWPTPDAAPIVTIGLVAERRMLGALLQELLRPADDKTLARLDRLDMLSFNRLEGQWDYVSFDTRAPVGLMPASSDGAGDGRTIDLVFAPFAVPGPGTTPTGQLLRMRQTITFEAADRDMKSQHFTLADGTGRSWLAHRYAYTKRA